MVEHVEGELGEERNAAAGTEDRPGPPVCSQSWPEQGYPAATSQQSGAPPSSCCPARPRGAQMVPPASLSLASSSPRAPRQQVPGPRDGHVPAPDHAPLGPCFGVLPSAGHWSPSTRETPLTKRLQPLPWQRRRARQGRQAQETIWVAAFSAREREREPRARGHCFKRTVRKAFSAETRSPAPPPQPPGAP